MIKGIFTSDFHFGLSTDGLDRTQEIYYVIKSIFKYAIDSKCRFIVIGGDLFNHNNPGEELISLIIKLLNFLNHKNIIIYIIPGNHDAIATGSRRSCLEYIKELKAYKNIKLITDIRCVKVFETEFDNVYFTFLPYITKSHIDKKYKKHQEYYDKKCKMIMKKIPPKSTHYVFSHLNVKNHMPGSEEYLLKKVDVHIPEVLSDERPGQFMPIIVNGHLHTKQKINNNNIVGSPIFCDFGEKEKKKYFVQLNVSSLIGDGRDSLEYVETKCKNFKEFHLEVFDEKFNIKKEIKKIIKKIDKRSILKINVDQKEEFSHVNWDKIREEIAKYCYFIKPINPRILKKRIVRNKKQTILLDPNTAVKTWLKKNKPKYVKDIYNKSKQYMCGA